MLKSRSGQCLRTAAACLRSNRWPRPPCRLLRRPADCPNRGQSALANQRPLRARSSRWPADTCSACSTLRHLPCPRTGASSTGGRGTSWPARRACRETPPDTPHRVHSPTPQDPRACRGGVRGYEKTSLRSGGGLPAWLRIRPSSVPSCAPALLLLHFFFCTSRRSRRLCGFRFSYWLLALSFSLYPPERAQPKPGERNREAYRKQQPPRSCRVARLVLPVLAQAGERPDPGNRQKHESGHFQPELVQYPPERTRRRADRRQHRPARPAALQQLGGHTENQLDFSRRLAVDHQSLLAAAGRTMTMGGITSTCDVPH